MSSLPRVSNKIVAVGKNYLKHVKEMGGTAALPKPTIFLKPWSSVIEQGESIEIADGIGSVHHEVELGVFIAKRCKQVSVEQAADFVDGYCVGLDMTARDIQADAKAKSLPWTEAKGYDTFTPLGFSTAELPTDATLWLSVDGVEKQRGGINQMIFSIPELISWISHVMTLEAGDLILTGTPEGVGPVEVGQRAVFAGDSARPCLTVRMCAGAPYPCLGACTQTIRCGIDGLSALEFPVIARPSMG